MWYRCFAKNPKGQIKVYGWGNNKAEAEHRAVQAALQYINKYEPSTPIRSWTFIIEDRSEYRETLQACNKTGFPRRLR